MRLLTLKIQEPLPGLVYPEMAVDHGPDEAARRYRAVAVTTLRQLRGLADTRFRLSVEPSDAHEAVRFWLLPRLAEKWQAGDGFFRTNGWEIDFGGNAGPFEIQASGEILCPFLGSRWVHTALLGLGRTTHQVIGPAIGGGEYFRAHAPDSPAELETRILPELPVIQTSEHWQQALDSALGPALKKAWEEEA
ncbi:MAG: hypothetical protein ABIS50_14680 [Luteolibacter sp.]|uniref:hypothetical protein n=1 Tax=Luteolibacter sp. TaxID=1962973 RepID=UPI003265BFC4